MLWVNPYTSDNVLRQNKCNKLQNWNLVSMGYEILPLSCWHSFVPQIQLTFPICLFFLSLPFCLILISCFELHPAFNPPPHPSHKYKSISVIYCPRGLPVILAAPLWMPPEFHRVQVPTPTCSDTKPWPLTSTPGEAGYKTFCCWLERGSQIHMLIL